MWQQPFADTFSLEQLPPDQQWLHLSARQAERVMLDLAARGQLPKVVDVREWGGGGRGQCTSIAMKGKGLVGRGQVPKVVDVCESGLSGAGWGGWGLGELVGRWVVVA